MYLRCCTVCDAPENIVVNDLSITHLTVSWTPLECSEPVIYYTVYLAKNEHGLDELPYKTNGTNLSLKVGPGLLYETIFLQVSATTAHEESARSEGVWAQPGKESMCI